MIDEGRWLQLGLTSPCAQQREFESQRQRYSRRFFTVRPELRGPSGRFGIELVSDWLWQRAASWCVPAHLRGGEFIWHWLDDWGCPPEHESGCVLDAASGFLGFLGGVGVTPQPIADRLRGETRSEGLAWLAHQMGLLPREQALQRKRHFAPARLPTATSVA